MGGAYILTGLLFVWWQKVRDGTRCRVWFFRQVKSIRPNVVPMLERGGVCGCAKTTGMCREILAVEPALWRFARVEGPEPTNNAAERVLRPEVRWRKRSFGCASEAGCRFIERVLTAVQTLRLQQRDMLAYLTAALGGSSCYPPGTQTFIRGVSGYIPSGWRPRVQEVNAASLPDSRSESRSHVQAFLQRLVHLPERVRSYFHHPSVQYAQPL